MKEFSESQDSRVEAGLVGHKASQVAPESQVVKNLPTNAGDARGTGSIPGSEDPLEEGMATHIQYSSLENPRDRESGGLPSPGSHRVRHD